MKKKRKKSFDEKLRLSREQGKNINEESKLKHGDDYLGKIIKDNERFQDKRKTRTSKRQVNSDVVENKKERRHREHSELEQIREEKKTSLADYKSEGSFSNQELGKNKSFYNRKTKSDKQIRQEEIKEVRKGSISNDREPFFNKKDKKNTFRKQGEKYRVSQSKQLKEVYDPLEKDTDNDGIIDRYDNNFKDSDYFESTYDVEDEEVKNHQEILQTKKARQRKIGQDFRRKEEVKRSKKKLEESYKKSTEDIYDPLGKDLDNDGIIDRYDHDFRDSDYLKSTFDLDDLGKEKSQKNKYYQKKNNKRKNYSEEKYTRSKDSKKDQTKGKKVIEDRKKKNNQAKDFNKKLKKEKTNSALLLGVAKSQEVARDYLSSGSEENAGVESGEKLADTSSKLIHKQQKYLNKRKAKKAYNLKGQDKKIRKKKSKLDFREELERARASDKYKKASAYKKFQKRRQMKAQINKQHKTRFRDRVKENLLGLFKNAREMVVRKSKAILIGLVGIIVLGTFIISFGGSTMTGFMNTASSTLATSYLSEPNVLTEVNQHFSFMEQELQDKLDNIESAHPGYDEYIINKDGEIYHNTHELLSYITSRYGGFESVDEVKGLLEELFEKMYDLSYETKTEIRYRTKYETRIDSNGNRYRVRVQEAYEYKIFIANLKTRSMDSVIREILADYPDNIVHYEALLASGGNMGDFFGSSSVDLSEIINNPNFGNPGLAFDDASVRQLFSEAEKHIGKRYVFGANGPNNFDCSSFVCWSFTKSGIKDMPRTTAQMIYSNYCTHISPSEAKPGDIIFFSGTYNSGSAISHVGIYAGDGMMIHAGDPIQYTSINSNYWKQHFYAFGRPR
ncbi:CD1108 family mobile element protein [Facklamia sp. P12955]|uniref:C40 family peptidase n=1 Tax=Facklamia sp. P12955 TaxID=3421946 RepID=UPI003D16C6DB